METICKKYYFNDDEIEFWQDLEEFCGIDGEKDEFEFETIKDIFSKNEYIAKNEDIYVSTLSYNNKEFTMLEDMQEELIYMIVKEK